jgi:hypothetical protein
MSWINDDANLWVRSAIGQLCEAGRLAPYGLSGGVPIRVNHA